MTAALIRDMAALSGLTLSLERAAALMPALEPVFTGDAQIIALELGTLNPLETPWTLETAPLETVTLKAVLLETASPEAGHD